MKTLLATTAALAVLTLTIGCGDTGSAGGGSSAPSAAQAEKAQNADAAGDAANKTMSASSDGLLDAGSGGAVTAKGTVPAGKSAAASFNFQANVTLTLDLDATNASGADLFPNATGQLNIMAAGSISGSPTAGTATYDVETTWLTEGVFSDPVSGVVAKMSAGSGLQYSLSVAWTWTAADDWTITATSDLAGAHTVTVIDGAVTYGATASGSRHVDASITQTPSSFSIVLDVTGQRTVTLTNGLETHVVSVAVAGLGSITITVDGTVFGPYTAFQIRAYFGCVID